VKEIIVFGVSVNYYNGPSSVLVVVVVDDSPSSVLVVVVLLLLVGAGYAFLRDGLSDLVEI